MTKAFTAINDPVHNLIRNLTRRIALVPRLSREGHVRFEYQVDGLEFPVTYWGLALDHAVKGIPSSLAMSRISPPPAPVRIELLRREGCLDVLKLDRRCVRDVRLKPRTTGPGMVSSEILIYGTGILRARNDNPAEGLQRMLWLRYGRLQPAGETVYASIRCLTRGGGPGGVNGKELFDSTNVIYGDALGEIQQLWDRRADTEFLEKVARSLQTVTIANAMPAAFLPPRHLDVAMRYHLRAQAIWRKPPSSARSLMRRVETILDHTAVEPCPKVLFRGQPASRETGNRPENGAPEWRGDVQGYDGWLSGDGSA